MATRQCQLEYIIDKVSPDRLWRKLSTGEGLNEWMTGEVTMERDVVTFKWDSSSFGQARLEVLDKWHARFHWLDEEEFFDLEVKVAELTQDTILVITDFFEDEPQGTHLDIWEQQVSNLRRVLGLR